MANQAAKSPTQVAENPRPSRLKAVLNWFLFDEKKM
jgi:hypothetical protein